MKTSDLFKMDTLSKSELYFIKGGDSGPGDGPVDLNDEDIDLPDI